MSGWMGISSSGIQTLARAIEDAGVETHLYAQGQWPDLVREIQSEDQTKPRQPLILIGHSYGADNALRAAHKLKTVQIPVDLIITIDPTTPPTVPDNVKRCINIYQSNGAWDAFPWFRGIPIKKESSSSATDLTNWNVRVDRTDLLEPDTDHFSIPKNRLIHAEILSRVLEVCPSVK